MKVPFDFLFTVNKGHVLVRMPVRISGITIYSGSLDGIRVAGIDWSKQIGNDIEVKYIDEMGDKGVYVIEGIWGQ